MCKEQRTTQYERVLQHLQTHQKGLRQMQAVKLYGLYRLSAIVYNLRNNGCESQRHTNQAKTVL